jgi:hypothetical protein
MSIPMVLTPAPAGAMKMRRAPLTEYADEELLQITAMLDSGIVPSSERIKDYWEWCGRRQSVDETQGHMVNIIARMYRIQEEGASDEAALAELAQAIEAAAPL